MGVSIKVAVKHFAYGLQGLHHQQLYAGIGLHLQQQTAQHQVFLLQKHIPFGFSPYASLQLLDLPILLGSSLLQLLNPQLASIQLLEGTSFLLLAQLGTLPVPPHTLALLAVALLIPVIGTLAEEFREFVRVEVRVGDVAAQLQGGPEGFVLE